LQSVVDLLGKVEHLHVVSDDKAFETPCNESPKLTLHKNLTNFVKSSAIAELVGKTPNVSDILDTLREEDIAERLELPLIEALCNATWEDGELGLGETEMHVTGAGEPTNLRIDVANYDDLGDGVLLVPFSADVECMLYYYVEGFSVLDELDEDGSVESVNEHVWGVEQERNMHVEGHLSVDGTIAVDDIHKFRPAEPGT
jgi:hypothetical protein